MAVSTDAAFSGPYLANGATTVFPFIFKALTAADVGVQIRDQDAREVQPGTYLVSLSPDAGGAITFDNPPPAGFSVIPYLNPVFTQEIQFENGSAWLAEPVNEVNDRAALRDLALRRDVARAIKVPIGELGLELPDAQARAGGALFFDEDGAPEIITPDDYSEAARTAASEAERWSIVSRSHADRSDLAATQAAVAQPAYDTIAAGLAATVSGGVFNVRGSGDTFATSYRNDGGVPSLPLGAFPSKQYLDGLAPAIATKVIAMDRLPGVQPDAPGFDNGPILRAAILDAVLTGKTIDWGNREFSILSNTAVNLEGGRVLMRGDGATLVGPATNARFANLRAPLDIDGVNFRNWGDLFVGDRATDLAGHDIIIRNMDAPEVGGILLCTQENFKIRRLIVDTFRNECALNAGGFGRGQAIRWQTTNYESIYINNGWVVGKNFQAVRAGGYPHDLLENQFITVANLHIEKVYSSGQTNGLQVFGNNFFVDNIYIGDVDCLGTSSNVEPFYCVGTYGQIGNITVDTGGNDQGAVAIKASSVKQHGPIRIRTKLHPQMKDAVRVDGADIEIDDLEIEWVWDNVNHTTGSGQAYAIATKYADTTYSVAQPFFFVPHTVNTSSAPTLNVNAMGPKPMVFVEDASLPYPGQIRPGLVYRADYNESADRFSIAAVHWPEHVPYVQAVGGVLNLPDSALVDGACYWIANRDSTPTPALISIGGSTPLPVKSNATGALVNRSFTNGFPRAFYYSAANNCLIAINKSLKAEPGKRGRFVLEPVAQGDAYVFPHPYPADYKDGLFIIFPAQNAGAATINVDGTARSILTSTGGALNAGYLSPGWIYCLKLVDGAFRAVRIGGANDGIACVSGREGRFVAKNVRFINAQYSYPLRVEFTTVAEIDGVFLEGKSRYARLINLSAPSQVAGVNYTRAKISNVVISHFAGDGATVIAPGARTSSLEVSNIPAPIVRGMTGSSSQGTLIVPASGAAGYMGKLKMRNVEGGDFYGRITANFTVFSEIDDDGWTLLSSTNNPASLAAGAYVQDSSITVPGARTGDFIQIAHSQNNTGVVYGGFVAADNTVTPTRQNPTNSAIDLPAGSLWARALKPKR